MLRVDEILKASGGKLASGSGEIRINGFSMDSRTVKKGQAFIAVKGDNFDGHDFIAEAIAKGAKLVISQNAVSPKLKNKAGFIQVNDTLKAMADIARFLRNKHNIPVIAITGSVGKTTVKEMIACVLSRKFNVLKNEGTKNNHIGLPFTLLGLNAKHEIAVLELGTNHPGEIAYLADICQPNIAVFTNIGPGHLEFFRNLQGVFQEKYSLVDSLRPPFISLMNADDRFLREMVLREKRLDFIIGYAMNSPSDFTASQLKAGNRLEFKVNGHKFSLNTLGRQNIYNALAAIALARIMGMKYADIAKELSGFVFPKGRLGLLNFKNSTFIDDTYNSNPFSLKQAVETLANLKVKGRKIFVMGDMLELGEGRESFHVSAGYEIAKVCDRLITVGELSKLASAAALACGFNPKSVFNCSDSQEAIKILFEKISPRKDDVVLVKGSRGMKLERIFKE